MVSLNPDPPPARKKFRVYKPTAIFYKNKDGYSLSDLAMFRRTDKILPKGMPDCLKKRRLLNEKQLSPALCREYGEKYLALGWWEDALEFFHKGHDDSGVEKIKAHGLEAGDAYLLARIVKGPDPGLWRQVAEKAQALGKLHFARRAFELAGDADKAAEVARQMAGGAPEL